eukprot:TRINITY_DN16309_c0_g1_i3.p1 TRINITY_DN16309_c0_g1~~TRINITY_DN16309_c0_g1_i3.p1  ORF type:complete len:221 (-),score=61.10 TRINITY_DN16309_c0_g1_i3:63-671(-)
MGLSIPFVIVLVGLGVNTVHGSLMNRIGLRLGGKPFHEQHGHRARVPWAVKQMREDLLLDERKPWQDTRNIPNPDGDDEVRPPPCVGICYYNKLVALEAKEDLTRHNEVYKQPDEPCDGTCNDLDEDIASQEDDHNEAFEQMVDDDNANMVDNNIIVIDEDAQSDYSNKNPEATDTIYIDDTAEDSSKRTPDIDIGHMRFGP